MVGQLKQNTEQLHLNHMQKTQRENGSEVGNTLSKHTPSDTHLFQKTAPPKSSITSPI